MGQAQRPQRRPAPGAFKGFANNAAAGSCGRDWTSRPGNSSSPPATIPSYMAVFVASSVSKDGPQISGNSPQIVIVKTGGGYADNPGHEGTGPQSEPT